MSHQFKILCIICKTTPAVMPRVQYCFGCWPGGPVTPPPCLRCGSRTNYFASGLCARCHPSAIPPVESCLDCLAWGATRHLKWLCTGCNKWWQKHRAVAACRICSTTVNVAADGACRLCHRQATMMRNGNDLLDLRGANTDGQQLFFADMYFTKAVSSPKLKQPPAVTVPRHPPEQLGQLTLFETRRDLAAHGRVGLAERCDPTLAAEIDAFVADHAARHGWVYSSVKETSIGIRILYGLRDDPDRPIKASDADLLRGIEIPVPRVLEILARMGQLEDDRDRRVDTWFSAKTIGMPEKIREELGIWFLVMRDGSSTPPRRRPRSESSIMTLLREALPAIDLWIASGTTSLREITASDVLAVLPTESGPRAERGQGLKSIFRVLKQRKLIFIDPIRRIATGQPQSQPPLPQDPALLIDGLNSPDPARALIVALIAYHGLRMGMVRHLQLTDIQNGRMNLGDRVIPLAPSVSARLGTYLDERTTSWPATANPYLLVNSRSAWRTTPVGHRWVQLKIGTGLTVQAIREDRILDEAHASRGDTRRLTDLFGISINAALRYTNTVDHPAFDDLSNQHPS